MLGIAGISSVPRIMKTLRNPASSGVVSCVVAFPDGKHLATCAFLFSTPCFLSS
jgi:transcriptional activator SPT8